MSEQTKSCFAKTFSELPGYLKKCPVEFLLSLTYFILAEYAIIKGVEETAIQLLFFFPFIVIAFTLNRYGLKWVYYPSYLLWLLGPVLVDSSERWDCGTIQYVMVYVISVIALFLPPKISNNVDYSRQTAHFLKSIGLACLISLAIMTVLLLIFYSLVFLFGWNTDEEKWLLSLCAFAGILVLPPLSCSLILGRDVKEKASSALSAVLNFVLSPALIIYTVILYAYIASILHKGELPNGGVAYMVLAYILVSLGCYILGGHLKNKPFLWFYRWFPAIAVGPVVLLWMGTLRRISDYGFTTSRVYLFALVILTTVFLIMLMFEKTRNFKYMVLAVGITAVLLTYIPGISADRIAIANQQRRLETVLPIVCENGRFKKPDNKAMADDEELRKDWEQARSAFYYLKSNMKTVEFNKAYGSLGSIPLR